MRTILLHVTVAVMAQYAINGVQSNTNNRYDSRHYFSGMMKRQTTEGSSSKDQEKEINQGLQEIAAISRGYDPSLDKTASKSNFEEEIERISLRNDIISSGRKVEEDFEDFVNEARAKRQVLKDLNAMWKSGVFYTFNTSENLGIGLFLENFKA
uniref:RxLR effector protein n=1 Tax=Angiostrongylus cantonensis TaxID=6313 RepID=A0A0K0DJH6_ANGCA